MVRMVKVHGPAREFMLTQERVLDKEARRGEFDDVYKPGKKKQKKQEDNKTK